MGRPDRILLTRGPPSRRCAQENGSRLLPSHSGRSRSPSRADRALLLRRGQVGTVVMAYDGTAFEVEFAGKDGRPYALLPIAGKKLIVLHEEPEFAGA